MAKTCGKCRRKWNVSIMNKQSEYTCPDCDEKMKRLAERASADKDKRIGKAAKEASNER